MGYILSSERVKEVEKNVIDNIGIPASVLMERAADSVCNFICEKFKNNNSNILIVCGNGNNGADGLCLARLLANKGYHPTVFEFSGKKSELNKLQKKIIVKISESYEHLFEFTDSIDFIQNDYGLIVDAIFGIGINRNLDEDISYIIDKLNSFDGTKISIDIPSGLNSTSGIVMGSVFKADYTICVGALKTGLYMNDGPLVSGEVLFSDIGLWYKPDLKTDYEFLEEKDIKNTKVLNKVNAHKGTYGKTLVIAGSESIYGACFLSAKAALLCGAGMVKVISHRENRDVLQKELPEALYSFYDKEIKHEEIDNSIEWSDTIVIGPGLSMCDISFDLVKHVINSNLLKNKILVIDADGLNILSQNKELFLTLSEKLNSDSVKCVLTPHKKELKRLFKGVGNDESMTDFLGRLSELGYVIVDKDCKSRIIGDSKYINLTGNDGMATAGSGDVLSGILGGLIFRLLPYNSFSRAVAVCVWLHGKTGDISKEEKNHFSVTASLMCDNVAKTLDFLT